MVNDLSTVCLRSGGRGTYSTSESSRVSIRVGTYSYFSLNKTQNTKHKTQNTKHAFSFFRSFTTRGDATRRANATLSARHADWLAGRPAGCRRCSLTVAPRCPVPTKMPFKPRDAIITINTAALPRVPKHWLRERDTNRSGH